MAEQSVFSGFNIGKLNSPKAITSTLDGIQLEKNRIMSEMEKNVEKSGIDPAVFAAFKAGDAAAKAQIDEAVNGPAAPATGGPFKQVDPSAVAVDSSPGKSISGGTDSPLVNPFVIEGEIKNRAGKVQEELDTTVNFAQANRQRVQENQAREAETLRVALEKKQALNTEDEAADADFKNRVSPFLNQKAKLDQRVAELATDKSLMTKIKGIFNSNFNAEKLSATSDKLTAAIQDMGFNYSVAADARAQDFASVDRRLKDDLTMGDLETSHADEDLRANTIALQAAEQNFQFPGQMLGQQTQILVAQMAQRDEFLANQDAASISDLLGKASKTGSVEINGIPISKGALEEIARRNEQLDLQMKSARLAYSSNQIQHGDLVMRKAMQYMTVEQLNAAKANGGMYKGMKLPPAEIDARIAEGIQARLGAATAQTEMAGAPTALNQSAGAFAQNLRTVRGKLLSTFGGVPQALNPQMAAITQAGNQMSAALREAKSPSEISALSAVWLPKIQALQAGFDKQVDAIATSMGEGDPVGAEFSRKFLRGEQMTAEDSFRFGKHFAEKGEMPSTIRSNPGGTAVTAAYQAAKKSVDDYITANGLKNLPDSQKSNMIKREFQKQAPKIVARQSFDDLHSKLPHIAKTLKSPLGDIGTAAWARANAAGDSTAAALLGQRLGLTEDQAQIIFAKGTDPRITKELRSKVSTARYAGFLEALDQMPGWKGTERPSDTFVNLLASPEFLNRAGALDQARAGSSVGAAAANGVGQGELSSLLGKYSEKLSTVNAERTATRVGGSFLAASRYSNDGVYKAKAVLGAIKGLNPADEAALVSAIRNQIRGEGAMGAAAQGVKEISGLMSSNSSNSAFGAKEFEAVSAIITDSKFDDPRLERLRKIAAKDWRESAESLDRAVDRLGKPSQGDDE